MKAFFGYTLKPKYGYKIKTIGIWVRSYRFDFFD